MSRPKIGDRLRRKIRASAEEKCGYCQAPQRLVHAPLEIDHLIPPMLGGTDEEENLWLACPFCNGYKAAQIGAVDSSTGTFETLFNPRRQSWNDHFEWSKDGLRILGITAVGRVTVIALRLNHDDVLRTRAVWINCGLHPPN